MIDSSTRVVMGGALSARVARPAGERELNAARAAEGRWQGERHGRS
ncbi:hypothetical protein ACWGCI_27550 [Streptomyces sp. NPDC054949]|nr:MULTISPECIES: hypothetical protein [unclassified Streptomyces]WUD40395.1 hypothetical protein OHA84_07640 [Streptomyces sp. NBC_00513]MCX5076581.1 hypothetical protein [Streptomyces sp. NBC_00424]MCX5156622.1 hypothetical protein [Streptomyces sp. NBC_00291]MCY0923181.1 hypothetical protein [Streptomyces sp. H27-G5]MCY0959001.1 hypothetical protein [Streptomyces sp. H27-H5]